MAPQCPSSYGQVTPAMAMTPMEGRDTGAHSKSAPRASASHPTLVRLLCEYEKLTHSKNCNWQMGSMYSHLWVISKQYNP